MSRQPDHTRTNPLGHLAAIALAGFVGCGGEGTPLDSQEEAILNGIDADGEYPHVVGLSTLSGRCTATLIRETILLTAAHCLGIDEDNDRINERRLAGGDEVFISSALLPGGGANRLVQRTSISNDVLGTGAQVSTDMAMILLDRAVVPSGYRAPRIAAATPQIEDPVTVVGLGLSGLSDTNPRDKKRGELVYKGGVVLGGESRPSGIIQPRTGRDHVGCAGDSGGPVFFGSPNGDIVFAVLATLRSDGGQTRNEECELGVLNEIALVGSNARWLESTFVEYERASLRGTVLLNNGNSFTRSSQIEITWNVVDGSGDLNNLEMCLANPGSPCTFRPFQPVTAWTLPPGEGPRTVVAALRDRRGNRMDFGPTIVVDGTAPFGGSARAERGPTNFSMRVSWQGIQDVTSGVDGFDVMACTDRAAGNVPACRGSRTAPSCGETAGAATLANLSAAAQNFVYSGGTAGATYFVRVCGRDRAGNRNGPSASFQMPTEYAAPVGSVLINGGAARTTNRNVSLRIQAQDVTGVTGYCFGALNCNNFTPVTSRRALDVTVNFALAGVSNGTARTVYVRFIDAWGNISGSSSDTIVF